MNVFEDLIVELKEENLLESTVIDDEINEYADPDRLGSADRTLEGNQSEDHHSAAPIQETLSDKHDPEELGKSGSQIEETLRTESDTSPSTPSRPQNGREFYKKRAIGEISNLQMVEHVLTGVEREYLKILPRSFDDFAAKKALNTFLQVLEDENSAQHAEAEFAMMQETETWCTALAERDRDIPVSSIRQYCENSRPALSSQALVALARFYRNLPYSEMVRSKFDFVITRLFSRPAADQKRVCLFTREEMLNHITLLYREWSSIPLYSADEDDSKVLLTALSFDELAVEAESASTFDLLVSTDFFGRLRMFKESVSELFYAPNVTAAAIECNIRIGNAYVTLIDAERKKMEGESIYSKFGSVDSRSVSDATAHTLEIVDILRRQGGTHDSDEQSNNQERQLPASGLASKTDAETRDRPVFETEGQTNRGLSVNRWVLIVTLVLIAASIGISVWGSYSSEVDVPKASVRTVEIGKTPLKEHISTARISDEMFYAMVLPNWETLTIEKRESILKEVYVFAREKGCSQVSLLRTNGKPAGFANAAKTHAEL